MHTRPRRRCCLRISPYEDTQTAPANNQAMAATSSVATIALQKLGLKESVSSFLSTYTVSSVTARVLTITASGPSANQAQLRAGAVASAFLTFRANELRAQQNLVVQSLNQQINQAKQRVSSIDAQISQLSSQPASPAQQSQLGKLRAERTSAENTLSSLQQAVAANQTTTLPALTAALKNSQVLSVSPIPYSEEEDPGHLRCHRTHRGTCRGPEHRHHPGPGIRSATPTGRRRVCARRSGQAQRPYVGRTPPASALAWPGRQAEP